MSLPASEAGGPNGLGRNPIRGALTPPLSATSGKRSDCLVLHWPVTKLPIDDREWRGTP